MKDIKHPFPRRLVFFLLSSIETKTKSNQFESIKTVSDRIVNVSFYFFEFKFLWQTSSIPTPRPGWTNRLSVTLSFCLFDCLSVCLFFRPSVCLPVTNNHISPPYDVLTQSSLSITSKTNSMENCCQAKIQKINIKTLLTFQWTEPLWQW
jgi:hypothetical protein